MISSDMLESLYTRTYANIKRQTAGLSHEDSLLQFPFGGNCLNWILGHVTVARLNVLAMTGEKEVLWNFSEARRYIPGSAPILNDTSAIRFETILAALDRTQARLVTRLQNMKAEDLDAVIGDNTLGFQMAFYQSHEAFHTGQIEICRRLAGNTESIDFE